MFIESCVELNLNLAIDNLYQQKPHYYSLLGKLYFEAKSWDLAVANFKLSLAQKPMQAESLTLWAAVELERGQAEASLQRLNLAIETDKNYAAAYYYRGLAYFELLEPTLACQDWEMGINLGFEPLKELKKQFCK